MARRMAFILACGLLSVACSRFLYVELLNDSGSTVTLIFSDRRITIPEGEKQTFLFPRSREITIERWGMELVYDVPQSIPGGKVPVFGKDKICLVLESNGDLDLMVGDRSPMCTKELCALFPIHGQVEMSH